MLAKFSVLTRLHEHENSNLVTKMRVYAGENLKDTGPKAKSMQEYREAAGVDEGMTCTSTRYALQILSETFTFASDEVAADPVPLMYVLDQAFQRDQFPKAQHRKTLDFTNTKQNGPAA